MSTGVEQNLAEKLFTEGTFKQLKEHLDKGYMIDMLPFEVVFVQNINEDDFVERGMKGLLTDVEETREEDVYKAFFYFGKHYNHNKPLFKKSFYKTPSRDLGTAEEAGLYEEYCTNYVTPTDLLSKYLRLV